MSPALSTILLLHRASNATQIAHDALVELGLHEAAALVRHHGEAIAIALGKVVKHEADRRAREVGASAAEVVS